MRWVKGWAIYVTLGEYSTTSVGGLSAALQLSLWSEGSGYFGWLWDPIGKETWVMSARKHTGPLPVQSMQGMQQPTICMTHLI